MSSVNTAFKVHYNQKSGDPSGHLGGNAPWPLGGDRRPWRIKKLKTYSIHQKG